MKRLSLIPLVLVALAACEGTERGETGAALDSAAPAAEAAVMSDVEHAVAIRRGIEAAPDAADSVLAAHGLTEAGLDSLMYRIAADSASAAEYTRAVR